MQPNFLYVSEEILELISMQGTTRPTGEAIFCETDNLPNEFKFICNERACFVPHGFPVTTDINKTGNMCTTLGRVRVTIFAVEKQ